jgi:hypothetical protein
VPRLFGVSEASEIRAAGRVVLRDEIVAGIVDAPADIGIGMVVAAAIVVLSSVVESCRVAGRLSWSCARVNSTHLTCVFMAC